MSDSRYSKRFRVPVSCSVCRKRKSRCDRVKPVCGTCKKKLIAHLCSYEDDVPGMQQNTTTFLPVGPLLTTPIPQFPKPESHSGSLPGSETNQVHHGLPYRKHSPMYHLPGLPVPHHPQSPLWGPPQHLQQQQNQQTQHFVPSDHPVPHLPHLNNHHYPNHSPDAQARIIQPLPPYEKPSRAPLETLHYLGPQYTHAQGQPEQASNPGYQPDQGANPAVLPQPPIVDQGTARAHIQGPVLGNLARSHGSHSSHSSLGSRGLLPLPHSFPGSTSVESPRNHTLSRSDSLLSSAASLPGIPDPSQAALKKRKVPTTPPMASVPMRSHGSSTGKPNDSDTVMAVPMAGTTSITERSAGSPVKDSTSMHSVPSHEMELPKTEKYPTKEKFPSTEEELPPEYVSISIGSNILQIEMEDTLDSFSAATNSLLVEGDYWSQQGPLSYVGLTKSDPFIKLVRSFSIEIFKSDEFSQFVRRKKPLAGDKSSPASAISATSLDDTSRSERSDQTFDRNYAFEERNSEDETDLLSGGALLTTKIKADETDNTLPFPSPYTDVPGSFSLQSMSRAKLNYYKYVEDQVIRILPTKRSLYNAVSRYFKFVASFVPIFHEHTFMSEVRSLFGGGFPDFGDGYYKRFFIRDEQDLNLTAQLLLIMRLGYMSLIPTDDIDVVFSNEEKHLIKDITRFKSDHYLSIINLCISEEKIQTRSTFKIVQSLTLLYFYRSVAPNDCLGISGADLQLLFGSIVNHALSIGLNRDPVNYDSIHSIPKKADFVQTWRSLWHFIVHTDAMGAMLCGSPLKIPTIEISDVEPPKFDKNAKEREELFQKTDEICNSYRRVLNKLTNLHDKPKVIDILRETSCLEGIFLSLFGQDFFRDYICSPAPVHGEGLDSSDKKKREESLLKVSRFLTFLHLRASLSCLYYLIVIHYEEKLDKDASAEITAGIELFKIFIRSVVQLVYIMSYALDNSQELFGRHYDFILTSGIERSLIKTHNFVTSFFIRLINYKRLLVVQQFSKMANPLSTTSAEEDLELAARSDVTDTLFTIVMAEAELFVGNFCTLSKTYINSYKIYVMAYFVLKQCMENPEKLFEGMVNHKKYFHDGTNLLQFLSIVELQSLCKLCEEFRTAKVELIRRQKTRPKTGATSEEKGNNEEEPFDAMMANRTMYANRNTVNTYGILQEKHMYQDFEKQAFDEQLMIGNEELLKLFELYGDLDAVMGV